MSLRPGKSSKDQPPPPPAQRSAGYYAPPPPPPPPGAAGVSNTNNGSHSSGMDASSSSRHSAASAAAGGYYNVAASSPYRASTASASSNISSPYRATTNPALGKSYASKLPPSPFATAAAGPPTSPYAKGSYGGAGSSISGTGFSTTGPASPYQSSSYGGIHNHQQQQQQYANEGYKEKPLRAPKQNFVWALLSKLFLQPRNWPVLVALFFFGTTLRYNMQQKRFLRKVYARSLEEVVDTVQRHMREKESLRSELRTLKESQKKQVAQQIETTEQKNRALLKQVDELKMKHEGPEAEADRERADKREEAWIHQVQLLQQATSRESRRAVTEKFGPGPHYVEIFVTLPHLEDEQDKSFVIEMAPLESMPHAVHLFLEQVAHGLWNSAWFYVNGPHVLQAGPQASDAEVEQAATTDNNEDERSMALRPFRELQLETLSFPEYSEDFPHVRWTLGFTGRPGGPDWYINKQDNTATHGPGGQLHHEIEEFADPCFAKVVKEFDTVKAMARSPTVTEEGSDYQYFLEEPIYITSMVIVDDPETRKPKKLEMQAIQWKGKEEQENDAISDEQLSTLSGEFLEAMNTQEGIEFLEKMQTERRVTAFDKLGKESTRLFDALRQSTEAESSQDRKARRSRKKIAEDLVVGTKPLSSEGDGGAESAAADERQKLARKPRRDRNIAPEETDEAEVVLNVEDDAQERVSSETEVRQNARKPVIDSKKKKDVLTMDDDDAPQDVPAEEEAAAMDNDESEPEGTTKLSRKVELEQASEARQRRVNRRKPKKRYRPDIDHMVEP